MAITIFDHPLILDKLSRMRRKETSSKDFRENLNEIGMLMVYEIFRDVKLKEISIKTPTVKKAKGYTIETPVVLVPIIRAGLGMVDGIQKIIPTAKIAHVGLYRDEVTMKPVEYYAKAPADIDSSYTIVVDPMLATGGSAVKAIDIIKSKGAKNIKFVGLVGVQEGIDALQKAHPDVDIFLACKDPILNKHGYIEPGMGDAGDRIFGTK
ncbi:uracil phosphoribosyltransferase [Spiroplasma sp. TIUS-1]|uniref:uracil phosphoribosyltransferase n=1 Tax=Spiroplasma sp. TIUS-1 TaxID=216963 RepID=UPI0013979691|nr:uracil phosphoribosyltransferase [Spiroplasma sp. TIUS-1]QHX35601.1 uracil phosphoribosyltransferase [Spiroplasma sp. TIUS-1]